MAARVRRLCRITFSRAAFSLPPRGLSSPLTPPWGVPSRVIVTAWRVSRAGARAVLKVRNVTPTPLCPCQDFCVSVCRSRNKKSGLKMPARVRRSPALNLFARCVVFASASAELPTNTPLGGSIQSYRDGVARIARWSSRAAQDGCESPPPSPVFWLFFG